MKQIKMILTVLIITLLFGVGADAAEDTKYILSEPWTFTIIHQTKVTNPSQETIRDLRITIPLMDTKQPVYQELLGEEFNLWPEKIIKSPAGIRKGIFVIPAIKPGQEMVLIQKYAVRNFAVEFSIDAGKITAGQQDYSSISSRYLLPETRIQSRDAQIINYAKDLVDGETNPLLIAQKLFVDINLFMTYKNGVNANKGALNAIRTGEGVCEDYTDLFVAAARALGLPARWESGYLYLPKEYTDAPYIKDDGSLDITLMRHAWPNFYLAQTGWVLLDPTFTYFIRTSNGMEKAVDWNKFAQIESSSRHIFFSAGSHDDSIIEFAPKNGPVVSFSESMVFGNNVFAFRDAVNSWAKDSIRLLTSYSPPIIAGYGNGTFGPDDLVTRAQLAAMINRAISLNYQPVELKFSDVHSGYWAYADIAAAQGAGIMAGYPDGTFRPNQAVSRAELAVIFDRAFDLGYPAAGFSFVDLGKPGFAWADASIVTLAGTGIAGGYAGGYFYPERQVTRAEFAAFLARVLEPSFRLPLNS